MCLYPFSIGKHKTWSFILQCVLKSWPFTDVSVHYVFDDLLFRSAMFVQKATLIVQDATNDTGTPLPGRMLLPWFVHDSNQFLEPKNGAPWEPSKAQWSTTSMQKYHLVMSWGRSASSIKCQTNNWFPRFRRVEIPILQWTKFAAARWGPWGI